MRILVKSGMSGMHYNNIKTRLKEEIIKHNGIIHSI